MWVSAKFKFVVVIAALFCVINMPAQAPSTQAPILYGSPVTMAMAKKAAAAAVANAEKNHLMMTVAIVDPDGELVYFERMDGSQVASVKVSINKARTAALYRRPTKFFEDAVASGGVGLRFLAMPDILPVDGGFPLIVDGKIIGAIGASGGTSLQDGACGQAGSAALN